MNEFKVDSLLNSYMKSSSISVFECMIGLKHTYIHFNLSTTIEDIVYKYKQLEREFIESRLEFLNNFRIFGIELLDYRRKEEFSPF